MRLIAGPSKSGKTVVLAEKALEKAVEDKVLIITNSPKEVFNRLSIVAKDNINYNNIEIVKLDDLSSIMKFLIKNSGNYKNVFIDVYGLMKDSFAMPKLEGFSIGAKINITVVWDTNYTGTAPKVVLYEQKGDRLDTLKTYSQKDINKKIS